MNEDDGENNPFSCSFVRIHYIICECGETFPNESDLKLHLEKEHPHKKQKKEYKCGICEATYPTEDECIEHYESMHISEETETEYVNEDESKYVVGEDYEDVDNEQLNAFLEQSSVCEYCGQFFWSATTHYCPAAPQKEKKKTAAKKVKIIKNVVCEVCGKKYASNAALRYHQRVHTGERPYKCYLCPKTFTMPLFLQVHVRTHTGERPFQCQNCPKAFNNKAALLRHDRVHTGSKPYKCPKCFKAFTQSNSMKLHVNTVHLKLPTPYKSKNRKLKSQETKIQNLDEQDVVNYIGTVVEAEESQAKDETLRIGDAEITVIKGEDLYTVNEAELYDENGSRIMYEVVYDESISII